MARAPSKYMQAVKDELKGRPRSTAWYREKIKELGTPTTLDLNGMVRGTTSRSMVS